MKIAVALLLLSGSALAQSAGGSWTRAVETDKMDGKTAATYSLSAVSGQRTATLSLICENGHFRFIDYSAGAVLSIDQMDGVLAQSMIRYRVDDKRIRTEWWDQAQGGQHAFSQSARLKELIASRTLMLRVSTFVGDVVTDEFPIAGLNLDMFHQDCGR